MLTFAGDAAVWSALEEYAVEAMLAGNAAVTFAGVVVVASSVVCALIAAQLRAAVSISAPRKKEEYLLSLDICMGSLTL
jgi:hypothetical protein